MIRIKDLTVKNFMSVGNQTQAVDFNKEQLTLVLGENLDQGGDDNGSRNGTGKTTIINALSYALYGMALTNIKRNNLINKTNSKGMLVTLHFEKNGVDYRIERGRSPNIMKFFINNEEQEMVDESQGDSRKTQEYINTLLGMSHDMFKHIVALNTYTEPELDCALSSSFCAAIKTALPLLLSIEILDHFSATITLASFFTIPYGWIMPDIKDLMLLMSIGILGGAANLWLGQSYKFSEVSLVTPLSTSSVTSLISFKNQTPKSAGISSDLFIAQNPSVR